MAIAYPLSLPTSIGIANISLGAENAVAVSSSPFTYRQQVIQHPGQRWTATVTIPPVRKEYSEPWVAFLLALRGQVGTFLLGDPNCTTPQGVVSTDTVLANNGAITGANSNGASTIYVDGFTPTTDDLLLPGDYIQLGTGATSTLHKVLTAVDSDSNGEALIDIWPAIRRDLSDNEAVTYTNAKGLFRLATNQQVWSINESSVYGISFDAVEAIV